MRQSFVPLAKTFISLVIIGETCFHSAVCSTRGHGVGLPRLNGALPCPCVEIVISFNKSVMLAKEEAKRVKERQSSLQPGKKEHPPASVGDG